VPTTCTKNNQTDLRHCDLSGILPEGQKTMTLEFFLAHFGHSTQHADCDLRAVLA
jgi:hypothetical protein